MAGKNATRTPPAEVAETRSRAKPRSREERGGLWVVLNGRTKQYGSQTVERPGQVLRKEHQRNDAVMLEHRYVRALDDHEEYETCMVCDRMFLGNALSGPYRDHQRSPGPGSAHDAGPLDVDAGVARRTPRPRKADDAGNPDSERDGDWDLEPDGAETAPPLEEQEPGGVRLNLGPR